MGLNRDLHNDIYSNGSSWGLAIQVKNGSHNY
jgi:hypothetical protein